MVNKYLKAERNFKLRFYLLLSFFISFSFLQAQNINKHFISAQQEEGNLYFVFAQKGFKKKKLNLTYDLTYLSSKDSITFNFSVKHHSVLKIDSIGLENEDLLLKEASKKLFIETKRRNWQHRYTSAFSFSDLEKFYEGSFPQMILYTSGEEIKLDISKSKWKKQSSIIRKILQLIELNKD